MERGTPSLPCNLADSDHGVFKAEKTYIDKSTITNENTLFSGTDNGIVTMTNTVGVTLDRFKFYLELYNRYDLLSDRKDTHRADDIIQKYNDDYLKPLPSKKILAADVDVKAARKKEENHGRGKKNSKH